MEDVYDTISLDREFQKLTLDELRKFLNLLFLLYCMFILEHQRTSNRSRILQLQNEISNLAFNNYRTYADVGRTAEHCKEMVFLRNIV